MKHLHSVKRMAEALGLDHATAIGYLEQFVCGLGEELLERGSVCLKGVGCFEVRHVPAGYRQGQWFPPVRRLVFSTRAVSGAVGRDIVERTTALPSSRAALFVKVFSSVVRDAGRAKQEFILEGIGIFSTVDGRYRFVADRMLEELLNQGYHHLPVLELHA